MERHIEELIRAGREAYDRREYGVALARFAQVLEAHPGFADIHNFAGVCLSLLGQPEAALAEFDQAIALNDGYIEAHLNRAITLNELGRYEEAQRAFERAGEQEAREAGRFPSAISSRLANAHAAVGELYLQAGAPAEAAAQFRAAVALRPQFLDIRNRLAQALIELGDLDGAEAELKAVLERNPRFLVARLNLGLVHFRRGELERAAAEWERCRELDGANAQVRSYLALIERRAVAHDSRDSGD